MANTDGWIKLHRVLMEKAIWKCSTPEQKVILITLLMMANHEPNEWEWMGKKFICNPGQMITSLNSIKKAAGKNITIKKIRNALDKFRKYDFLAYKTAKTGRHITIINWASYQSDDKKGQRKGQTGGKQGATNKNDKNDKNKEKIYRKEKFLDCVYLTKEEYQKLCSELSTTLADQYIQDLNDYMLSHGKEKKYKSHYKTVLVWYRKDEREGKTRMPKNKNQSGYEQFMEKVMNDRR